MPHLCSSFNFIFVCITTLLSRCLKCKYFLFSGSFTCLSYKQIPLQEILTWLLTFLNNSQLSVIPKCDRKVKGWWVQLHKVQCLVKSQIGKFVLRLYSSSLLSVSLTKHSHDLGWPLWADKHFATYRKQAQHFENGSNCHCGCHVSGWHIDWQPHKHWSLHGTKVRLMAPLWWQEISC